MEEIIVSVTKLAENFSNEATGKKFDQGLLANTRPFGKGWGEERQILVNI